MGYFLKILFIVRERGREGEREGEAHRCERETSLSCLGDEASTQACVLRGNRLATFHFGGQYPSN